MPEDDIFRTPYRIQTPDDVMLAKRSNFPGINKHYGTLLELAQTTSLVQPPAHQGALASAGGVFHLFREEKKRVCDVSYEEIAEIQLIEDFKEIEQMLPFDRFTPDQLTVAGCFSQLPPEIMKAIVPQSQQAPVTDIGAVLAIKKFLREEIRSYIATKTFHAVSPAQFRHMCAIYTLHQLDNEDIQHVLLNPLASRARSTFFQQALCDLLFVRIPRELNQITRVEPQFIKRRLFSRIERLGLINRQKINLFGYFKPGFRLDELETLLNRIDAVAAKILTPSTWQQLHSYAGQNCSRMGCGSNTRPMICIIF